MLAAKSLALLGLTGIALSCALGTGCVADRPSRNGVFNENQYLRKDFLIGPGDGSKPDEGWFVKTTIVQASTPNPLGNISGAGLFAGAEGQTANYVRFAVNQDTLSLVDMREISNDPTYQAQGQRTPEVVNAWPITNVDLKYRVNLDGEKTNFYEENQELDWQQRQWVKVNFAKNNLADLYAFNAENNPIIQKCTDPGSASVSLHNGSFAVDEANGYFSFSLDLTLPIRVPPPPPGPTSGASDTDTCIAAFGNSWQTFQAMGRQNVTFVIKMAFVRPSKMTGGSYVPMPIAEKDPINHKYGAFQLSYPFRDPSTSLLGANQYVVRHDPNKSLVYYFAPGVPTQYETYFTQKGGVADQTNAALMAANAKARVSFLNYNDATTLNDGKGPVRALGDPRYNWIEWHSDLDNGSGLLGIAQFFPDPRTGELLSSTVNVFEGALQDTVQQRLALFLQTVGSEFLTPSGEFDDSKYPPSCTSGQTTPLIPNPGSVANKLNRQSTVYSKMQQYLQRPFAQYGYLGPSDFLPTHDSDFYNAYFAILPYQIYADPAANQYVLPESSPFSTAMAAQWQSLQQVARFHALASRIDHGDLGAPNSPQDAVNFAKNWENLSEAVTAYGYTQHYLPGRTAADDLSLFSYFDIYQRDGRHCVNNKWESRSDYVKHLIDSLNMSTAVHEFGHSLGLRHNFMGSVDQRNFPKDSSGKTMLYSSSVMDYNQPIVEAFYETTTGTPVWGPYDSAAIAWIYGNDQSRSSIGPVAAPAGAQTGVSGQVSATAPWNDPLGFRGGKEIPFLYCTDEHTQYTPLCQRYDMGVTPSEIVANSIQQREWNYLWTNFRLYHKYFGLGNYGAGVVNDFNGLRRFQTMWAFDWSQAELTDDLRLIGFPIPQGDTAGDYYAQLYNKFETDISMANQIALSYERAIVDQSSGERPYITVFDPFFGDTTQQGIQLDKVALTAGLPGLWPAVSNFDPSQAAGTYLATLGGFGDSAFASVADSTLNDFLGAAFATYRYTQVGPLALFASTTHDPAYSGSLAYQTWVGGWEFDREQDFLTFVRDIAVKYNFQNCDVTGHNCQPCTSVDTCTWDPRPRQQRTDQITQSDYVNRFVGPDGRNYIWGYLLSRNSWVLADKDRNTATYTLMYNWQTDVQYGQDTGFNGASRLEYPVRFAVDSFHAFDNETPGTGPSNATTGGN